MSRRALVLVAVLAVAAVVGTFVGVEDWKRRSLRGDDLAADTRHALALRARSVLEGGASSDLGSGLACAVRVLGTEPKAVERADQAETAYVWVRCAKVGGPTQSSLPLAVRFTDPPVAEAPRDGSYNGPDTDRIFPWRLRRLATHGPGDMDALEAEMQQRRRELEGGTPR